jgi:hypothetical protein
MTSVVGLVDAVIERLGRRQFVNGVALRVDGGQFAAVDY